MLIKNGATPTILFVMVDSADHVSKKTGLTVTANITKNGGAFTPTTNAVTEIANGFYKIALTATETNTNGQIGFHCTATGADDTQFINEVVAFDPTDSVRLGLTAMPNAVAAANGGLPTVDANNAVKLQSGTGANQISLSAGLVTLAGVTHTGAVIPTVTTTTTATNLTNAPTVGDLTAAMKTSVEVAVWDASRASHTTAGSFGQGAASVQGNVTGSVGSVTGAVGSVTGLTASDVGAIKTKTDFLPSATAGAAGGVFIAGTNAATAITTGLTTTFTGNLTGSVASVTGAVGSVTGAVGSVTGAVGSVTGLTASDVGSIKTQTDKLVFTLAGGVDANIQYVNDVLVHGTGAAGSEWGP